MQCFPRRGSAMAVLTQEVLNLSPKSAKSEFVRGIFLAVNINHNLARPLNPGFYICGVRDIPLVFR